MKSISKSKAPGKFWGKVKYQERKLKKILKFIKNIRKKGNWNLKKREKDVKDQEIPSASKPRMLL